MADAGRPLRYGGQRLHRAAGQWIWFIAMMAIHFSLFPFLVGSALAGEILAGPENYISVVRALRPGDRLVLAPGVYRKGLVLHGLEGEPGRPISIEGAPGGRTVFMARPDANTVSIKNTAYIVIRDLVLDGNGIDADAVKAEGKSKFAHHITLERLTIINHNSDQQIVGISTKCPAWNWIIRGNVIRGAGTGMYLGNSDGSAPFIGGLIEHNLIVDTLGYNLQIKHQRARSANMPEQTMRTVIRNNVFSKGSQGSAGELARPNVLLGHFPQSGAGSEDAYEVYGNFFYENPNEALLQAEGNVAIFGNIFFNSHDDALNIIPHKGLPKRVDVTHNTILAKGSGISISGADHRFTQTVRANAVFAERPLRGGAQKHNVIGAFRMAEKFLRAPFAPLGQSDFSPRGDALDLMNGEAAGVQEGNERDFFSRKYARPTAGAVASRLPAPWHPELVIPPSKH